MGLFPRGWSFRKQAWQMALQDEDLIKPSTAAKRVAQIVKNNLLLVGFSMVGVRAVTGLIGFVLGLGGVVLG